MGYDDVHFNKIICLHPFLFKVITAFLISLKFDIPVDKITGFFCFATYLIKGISVISKDILYKRHF